MFKQPMLLISLLFLSNVLFAVLVSGTSSCSIDLSYVNTYPWDTSTCHPSDGKQCCQTLLSLFGMGLAQHLKDTGIFQLPDFESSSSCLSELQDRLASLSIQPSVVPLCFQNSTQFVVNASSCAGIVTTKDWINRVGPSSVLDANCKGGRTGLTWCSTCLEAGMTVNSQLKALSPNSTECFYFTVLYAAAIANEFGPKDARTASCILGLPLSNSASTSKMSRKTVLKWVIGLFGALIGVLLALVLIILHRKRDKKMDVWHTDIEHSSKGSSVLPKTGAKWFRLSELERATDGFSQKNLVGQGAYGVVYKGILSDGTLIAVKEMLDLDSKGDEDFSNEVEIISKIKHRNLLSLHGCCVTGDNVKRKRRFLVYDFMSNGSISDQLFGYGAHGRLTWPQRKNIILDIAKGLEYLHHGIKPPVYHRDIKATNILLDSEMRAKVADFGLAKQGNEGQSHLTTRVAGTYGYLAPEYALYGQLTEKSDVYSFGIVILQIMSGRKVLDTANSSMVLITDWAWMLAKSGKVEAIFDQAIEEGPTTVMERFVLVGILCAHVMVALRPTIADAIKMLEGDIDIHDLHDRPLPLGHESFRSSLSPIHRVEEKKSSNGSRAYLRV